MKRFLLLFLLLTITAVDARPGLLDSLGLSNTEQGVPLPVDEAFAFSAEVRDATSIAVDWKIADGNYLYRDKIKFTLVGSDNTRLLDFVLPAGKDKMDEIFGLSKVYQFDTEIILPLQRNGSQAQQITLNAHYQGCSETFKICYPPTEKQITLELPAASSASSYSNITLEKASITAPISEQDRIAKSLAEDNIAKVLIGFFGLGLLLAFTPCVFPMIPILSSIIVGEGENITPHRAFVLSLTYVLAMSVTYTVAGVLTGLLGENLQAMLQNPWVIGSFSALFVVLALSMFGLFELQLPHRLQHRLHQISHQQQGGHLAGAALMGLLSGLIVGPCLAPPLAGALIFIGQSGDPVLGGLALFSLSMGMGLPLLAIGTSAGSLLPRAGTWMHDVKATFGVLMLALAIWMLERILPGWVSLLLWGSLFIVSAVYLGALTPLNSSTSGWQKLWKGLGLIMLIYGGLLIVGAASGSHTIWQPLKALSNTTNTNQIANTHLQFTYINNIDDLNKQLASAQGVPIMLDFYADWCVDCKRMEATTFKNPAVVAALANTHLLQLDMTDNTAEHQSLLKSLNVFGPPTLLFFDGTGKEFSQYRLVGSINAESLLNHLKLLPATE
ncbi:MAG: protein-disulfide reductase DsbD [Gammaproteobacteria bacterium]|nr:MAG: protein-disulfide reductase DsbD [Gammaproteobacteria bacterium]